MQRTGRPRNYRDDMSGKKPRRFRQTLGNQVAVTVLGLSVAFLISTFELPQLDQSKQKLHMLLTTDTDFNRCAGQIETYLKNNDVTGAAFLKTEKNQNKRRVKSGGGRLYPQRRLCAGTAAVSRAGKPAENRIHAGRWAGNRRIRRKDSPHNRESVLPQRS